MPVAVSAQDAEAPAAAAAAHQPLGVGSAAPALEGVTWIQGEPIKSLNEDGKAYIIECWATWCGPCLAVIPHMNELHQKFAEKGLHIVGMNVWEEKGKAEPFVKGKGDEMSYPIAYFGGEGRAFETNWLKAAGVQGIPHAFIVKDGKIVYSNHPANISEALVEKVLAADFDAEGFAAEMAAQQKKEAEFRSTVQSLMQAQDWQGLADYAAGLEEGHQYKDQLLMQAHSQLGAWDKLMAGREKVEAAHQAEYDLGVMIQTKGGEGAEAYAKVALEGLTAPEGADLIQQSTYDLAKARAQFLVGNKEASEATLKALKPKVESSDVEQFKAQFGMILEAALKSVGEGKFPSVMELANQG